MKKFYFLALSIVSVTAYGQSVHRNATAQQPTLTHKALTTQSPRTTYVTYSLSYGDFVWVNTPSAQRAYYFNDLFPDSTVKDVSSTSSNFVGIHALGQVFDPTAANLDYSDSIVGFPLNAFTPYQVDAIGFPYRYTRPQNTNPDTVKIQFFTGNEITTQLNLNAVASGATVAYNPQTKTGTNFTKDTTILLTIADTANYGFMVVPVGLVVPAGSKFAALVSYFPGNPHAFGDTVWAATGITVHNPINEFAVFDIESGNTSLLVKGDYNQEVDALNGEAYASGNSTPLWQGNSPAAASSGPVFYNMDMVFQITFDADAAGIAKVTKNNIALSPNPASDQVRFATGFEGTSVVSVKNALGQTVNSFTANLHNGAGLSIPVNNLNNGVYILEVSNAKGIATAQFVKN